jgi:hypothetical protein
VARVGVEVKVNVAGRGEVGLRGRQRRVSGRTKNSGDQALQDPWSAQHWGGAGRRKFRAGGCDGRRSVQRAGRRRKTACELQGLPSPLVKESDSSWPMRIDLSIGPVDCRRQVRANEFNHGRLQNIFRLPALFRL